MDLGPSTEATSTRWPQHWLWSLAILGTALSLNAKEPRSPFSHRDVLIYQSHSGNFLGDSPNDAHGNFFDYYEPVEVVSDLIQRVLTDSNWQARMNWSQRRALGMDGFEALAPLARLSYLAMLEEHIFPRRAWDGKHSLLLKRKRSAPAWLDEHPEMTTPPGAGENAPVSYEFPKVVAKIPVRTVDNAMDRAEEVIAETGLSTTAFSVVLSIEPEKLLAQKAAFFSFMQEVNDELFLEAATRSVENILNTEIRPWEAGHLVRVQAILDARSAQAYEHEPTDSFDPAGTYLGLKFLGMKDGKMQMSFEIRGVEVDLSLEAYSSLSPTTRRNMNDARRYLDRVHGFAVSLAEGVAQDHHVASRYLEPAYARKLLEHNARIRGIRGIPRLETFARVVLQRENPEGILFPFSRPNEHNPALDLYIANLVDLVMRTEAAMDDADVRKELREGFWENYDEFALSELTRVRARSLHWMGAVLGPSCGIEHLAAQF
jgi:hypothetical protein